MLYNSVDISPVYQITVLDLDKISVLQAELQRASETEKVLRAKIQSLSQQIVVFQDEEKERELELNELRAEVRRLRLDNLDETKYVEWGPDEICSWIINLDIERMKKYEEVMKKNLEEDEADGSLLAEVDGGDLRSYGIGKLNDRKFVQKAIAKLVANNPQGGGAKDIVAVANPMANEGVNAAPTAYM